MHMWQNNHNKIHPSIPEGCILFHVRPSQKKYFQARNLTELFQLKSSKTVDFLKKTNYTMGYKNIKINSKYKNKNPDSA